MLKQTIVIILFSTLLAPSLSLEIQTNNVTATNENHRTLSHLQEMIQNYWHKNSSLPLCTDSLAYQCCTQTASEICDVCEDTCPCLCMLKRSAIDPATSKNINITNNVSPSASQPQTQPAMSSDVSFSAYTLILSIGLPSVSIILIICTLLSITYCCKPRPSRANDTDQSGNNMDPAVSVSNLSLVYINLDDNNNLDGSTINLNQKEPPPKYSDYIKGSFVDKLPSYKSFRCNKMNQLKENAANKQ